MEAVDNSEAVVVGIVVVEVVAVVVDIGNLLQ